jgi:hypothetical protein
MLYVTIRKLAFAVAGSLMKILAQPRGLAAGNTV